MAPVEINGLEGVTAIETSAGAVTVKMADPLIVPEVAVMVEVPAATEVANPAALMVAALVAEEVQVTELVILAVVPLAYVPVAVNCCVFPAGTDGLTGVTAMETGAGVVTVRRVDPLIVPEVAVIVEEPAATVVANPAELMVAALGAEEVQVAVLVRLAVVPLV